MDREPVLAWDHVNDPDYVQDPWAWFARQDSEKRAFWTEAHGGFWVVTKYGDIREVMLQTDLFSTRVPMVPKPPYTRRWLPKTADPPEHGPYRKLLQPLFSPRKMRELETLIREVCVELIDAVAARDSAEFVTDFSGPLPSILFGRLSGVRPEKVDWLRDVAHRVMAAGEPDVQAAADAELMAYLEELIQERRQEAPRQDWVGAILLSKENGLDMTQDDELNMLQFLFLAGLVSTTTTLTFTWWMLARNPELRARIIAQPDIIPSAVEEFLRITSNVSPVRQVNRDTEFAGVHLRAGDIVVMSFPAANHDPDVFRHPDDFVFDRTGKSHMAFGVGVHHCLGAAMARQELRIALQEWHRRIPDYEIVDESALEWRGGQNHVLRALPLRWPTSAP